MYSKKNLLFGSGEDTSGLDDVLGADGSPGDVGGVTLGKDLDGLSLDPELAILGLDGALEATVDGVVLEHVDHVVEGDEWTKQNSAWGPVENETRQSLIDGDDIYVAVAKCVAEHDTADTTLVFENIKVLCEQLPVPSQCKLLTEARETA